MSAIIVQLADAVVALLNAGSFSPSVTAERAFDPRVGLESLDTLNVMVVPKSETDNLEQRGAAMDAELAVDVCVRQRVTAGSLSEVDALLALMDASKVHLRSAPVLEGMGAALIGISHAPLYDPAILRESNVFLGLATVTYRAYLS